VHGGGVPPHPERQPTVAQDVGARRFLGDLHRVVQGQERLYERMGFRRCVEIAECTHLMELR